MLRAKSGLPAGEPPGSPAAGCSERVILADNARAPNARWPLFVSISSLDLFRVTGHLGVRVMKLNVFGMRRPITTTKMMLLVALVSCGVLASSEIQVDNNTPRVYAYLAYVGTTARQMKEYVVRQYASCFHEQSEEAHQEHRKIVVTTPMAMDVTITERHACQIHSRRNIEVLSLGDGYLAETNVQEGQAVKKGDVMFKIVQTVYQARLKAETAAAAVARLELMNSRMSFHEKPPVVAQNEVALLKAKLDRANAKREPANAELDFTSVKAPFDGLVDRLHEREGSLIKEGDTLTTLSDNSVMRAYFDVSEKKYLEYMTALKQHQDVEKIELELANQTKFPQPGKIGAIDPRFKGETSNIPFRADFPNPDGLLRDGQTGTILTHRKVHDATVIPMLATYELKDERYVYVVDDDDVVHRREIVIENEMDDIFLIKEGVDVGDRIVLEGIGEVGDGEKVDSEFRRPEELIGKE